MKFIKPKDTSRAVMIAQNWARKETRKHNDMAIVVRTKDKEFIYYEGRCVKVKQGVGN